MLAEAQRNYAAAIGILLEHGMHGSREAQDLELALLRGVDLLREDGRVAVIRGNVDREVSEVAKRKKKKVLKRIAEGKPKKQNRAWTALELNAEQVMLGRSGRWCRLVGGAELGPAHQNDQHIALSHHAERGRRARRA